MTSEEWLTPSEREEAGQGQWGTWFHRHFMQSEIHRDDTCKILDGRRRVLVYDDDEMRELAAEIVEFADMSAREELALELVGHPDLLIQLSIKIHARLEEAATEYREGR